jgi:Short C-terminal domain
LAETKERNVPGNIIKLHVGGRFKADELRKLSNLLKRGLLTRAEFDRLKRELLGRSRMGPTSSTAPSGGEASNEDELDIGESLIAEALAALAEPEESPSLYAANVVSFEKRT